MPRSFSVYLRTILALLMLSISLPTAIRRSLAQDSAGALALLTPVSGQITQQQTEQIWTFDAIAHQHVSLRIQGTSGDLNPYLELKDANGAILTHSGLNAYHAATLDDFVAPQAGTYTLRVTHSPAAESFGTYTLSLLPGFSFLLLRDTLDAHSLLRTWETSTASSLILNGKLQLMLRAASVYTWTTADKLGVLADCYVQADVQLEKAVGYWEQGIMLREVKKDDGNQFYAFFINSKGQWKFAISRANGLTTLQDWADMKIKLQDKPTTPVTIAAMAKGNAFTLFYNQQTVGSVTDNTIAEAGFVGLITGTGAAPDNVVSNLYSNIIVTIPTDANRQTSANAPATLANWQRSFGTLLAELRTDQLIPNDGKEVLFMGQAFVANNTPAGIVFIQLGRGLTVSDLVYSADVKWTSTSEDAACGIEFRAADTSNFTIVYFDRKGGYGVRQVDSKAGVLASEYNLSDAIIKSNTANNRITVIAIGNGVLVYLNGTLVANVNVKQLSGGIYVVAYNYARSSTFCQFVNLYVRSFD